MVAVEREVTAGSTERKAPGSHILYKIGQGGFETKFVT